MLKRFVFVALLAASGSAMASKDLSNIPLVWSPTQSFAEFGAVDLNGISNVKVQINGFTDVRKNPALIAENHEKNPVRQVITKDNVAAFLTDHVKETFTKAGLNVVDSGGDVVVSGEIRDFFVNENDQYVGNVTVYVTVTNTAGKVLWQGVAGGGATNFGRSYKADNYYETLSNSVLKLSNSLLNSQGFHSALQSH
ncbi:YajG family lipoprotein [Dyella sp.]|uniref:YajG family lipoprotein n=1 Tax=Dyella sp. TaxID=1869338 RepID=UPI0028413DCB|nr:YajG family lipoprotein [Dyella sp.]MDR3445750.1 YajG family lipoprotein [Dyella sp.]